MFEILKENAVEILIFVGGLVSVFISIINYRRTGKLTNVSSVKDTFQLKEVEKLCKKDWSKLYEYHKKYMSLWSKILEKTPDNSTARDMYDLHKSICDEIAKKDFNSNISEVI